MAERTKRQRMAELLRHLALGRIDNEDFEQRCEELLDSEDRTLFESFSSGGWLLYSDFECRRLSLSAEDKRFAARWILFLQSDTEYSWPDLGCCASIERLVEWLSGGLLRFWGCRMEDYGDISVFPFRSQAELDAARRHPRLLCGSR